MDTAVITSNQILPNAIAGADSTITCSQPNVFLIGTGSSSGPAFTPTWSGPGINAGNVNLYNPEVGLPGTYTLLITNNTSGCTATDTVLVNLNNALPTADAGADQQLTCSNPSGVTLNGSGSPANVTYLWSGDGINPTNETDQNPLVSQADTYSLTVTDPSNGCTATAQVIVTQDANVPSADGGPDHVLNCTVTAVDFDGSGSTSGPGITYNWNGPGINPGNQDDQSPTGLSQPGTYNLTVTNTNNGCSSIAVVIVQIDTLGPVADAGNTLTLNCFNSATDTLDASGSSLGSNFTLLWAGNGINAGNQNQVNPVISNVSGTYTLIVTDIDNTCTATDQVTAVLDLAPPTADAGSDNIIDCVVTTTVVGGSSSPGPNFSYLWTGPGIDGTNESLLAPTVDEPGTYTIVVTDLTNGCTASDDVFIDTDVVLPTVLAGNDGLLTCANPDALLDGSASSTGANFQILWTGPGINAGNENQPSPTVTVPGTYILQITDGLNSCVQRDTVVVDENIAVPAASAGLDLILDCQILNVTLDGSLSGVSPTIVYNWAGPGIAPGNQNNQSPAINQPGTYDLTVTDSENGCSATDQAIVAQDTVAPAASAGADGLITCAQLTQAINGSGSSSGPNILYVWQGPGINGTNFNLQSPTVSASGTYTVTVTNSINHCTNTDVVFVALNQAAPLIAAGPDRTLNCTDVTAQLDATQSASGPNISFLWSGPGILPGGQTSATPTVNLPGAYSLTVTDAVNGCTSEASVTVGIDTLSPLVFAGADLVLTCANAAQGVALSSLGSSTGSDFVYLWVGPGITPANEATQNPTVMLPGTYTLMVTDTTNGCANDDAVVVDSEQNLPTADAGTPQELTCAVTSVTLDGTGSSSPNGSLDFEWAGPGINAGNATSETPLVLTSGTYTLTVTSVTTGCSSTDQVIVTIDNTPPTVSATSDTITCLELLSTVAATSSLPGSTYLWTGPSVQTTNETNQSLEADQAGLYSVTVTAPNGCSSTANTLVTEDGDVPQGTVNGTVLNCLNNGTSQIGGEIISPTGSTATWTGPGIGIVNTSVVTVTQPGIYTFTISAPNGCVRPITAEVIGDFAQPNAVVLPANVA